MTLQADQQMMQAVHKFVHLKMPGDRITSVIIPTALMAVTGTLLVSAVKVQ